MPGKTQNKTFWRLDLNINMFHVRTSFFFPPIDILLFHSTVWGSFAIIDTTQEVQGEEECRIPRKNLFPIFHRRFTTNHNHTALFQGFPFFPSPHCLEPITWKIRPCHWRGKLEPVDILQWNGDQWDETHIWIAGCSVWGLVFKVSAHIPVNLPGLKYL